MVDRDAVEADWNRRGYSCDLWVDPPGQVWRDFVHPVDELVMVMEGELEMTTLGRTVRLKPGREFHIPAEALHTVANVGGTTARWLYGYRQRSV